MVLPTIDFVEKHTKTLENVCCLLSSTLAQDAVPLTPISLSQLVEFVCSAPTVVDEMNCHLLTPEMAVETLPSSAPAFLQVDASRLQQDANWVALCPAKIVAVPSQASVPALSGR